MRDCSSDPLAVRLDCGTFRPRGRHRTRTSRSRVLGTDQLTARRLAPLVAGVAALFVYCLTLLPGVGASDVAEMQTVPKILGIAHTTGYPLWTLVGFLWTRLPLGNSAFRMNLLTALFFAASVALLAVLGIRLGVRPWLGTTAALIFAFAGLTWGSAVHAEVQSLHVLLVAVSMFAAAGFGLAHQALMFLTAPPLIAWFCLRHLRVMWVRRTLLLTAVALIVPLLFYFYLPIRAAHGAPVVNAVPGSHGWFSVMLGEGFTGSGSTLRSIAVWWHSLGDDLREGAQGIGWFPYLHAGAQGIGWFPIMLAGLGVVVLVRRAPAALVGLLIVIAADTYGLARTQVKVTYLLVPLFVVTLLAAVGAEKLVSLLSARGPTKYRKLVAGCLVIGFAAVPLVAVVSRYGSYDQSGNRVDLVNAQRILAALPPHAVIWVYWDIRTTLQYEHFVDGQRPDVTILDLRSVREMGGAPAFDQFAVAASFDPALKGRPLCIIPDPHVNPDPTASSTPGSDFYLRRLAPIVRPYGYGYVSGDWLYLIQRSPVPL
jgi:hypothetical protein